MTIASGVTIRKLGPETLEDFLAFFEGPAYADNPHWAGCLCEFFHTPGDEWDATGAARAAHRATKIAGVGAGQRPGFLAYRDDRVVGWLNAAPMSAYQNPRGYNQADDGTPGVGWLMCFMVHPERRGEGIATALLEAACADFKKQGLRYAQGIARVGPKREDWETFSTMNYHGPLSMYEGAGFQKVNERAPFVLMRKEL